MSNHDEMSGQSLECGSDPRENRPKHSTIENISAPALSILIGPASAADIIRHLVQHSSGTPAPVLTGETMSGGTKIGEQVKSGGKLPKARNATTTGQLTTDDMSSASGAELIGAVDAAAMCGVGRTHWYEMRRAGRVPLPHRLGRRVLWNVTELRAWIAAGLPPLHQWNRIKEQQKPTTKRKG